MSIFKSRKVRNLEAELYRARDNVARLQALDRCNSEALEETHKREAKLKATIQSMDSTEVELLRQADQQSKAITKLLRDLDAREEERAKTAERLCDLRKKLKAAADQLCADLHQMGVVEERDYPELLLLMAAFADGIDNLHKASAPSKTLGA